MLRITANFNGQSRVLKLEGALREAWVQEVRDALQAGHCIAEAPLALDLSEVKFVDSAGIALLRELLDGGAKVSACSGFVAACLELEKP
jgi:anti-anti-sigma regulatory factor